MLKREGDELFEEERGKERDNRNEIKGWRAVEGKKGKEPHQQKYR